MARIPAIQEGQRLQASSPSGFQSSGAAGSRGRAIASFGGGLTNVGSALMENEKRQKNAEGRIANAKFKASYEKRLQDIQFEIDRKGGTGKDDIPDYDEASAEALFETIEEFDEEYGGEYSDQFDATGRGLMTGYRSGTIANSHKKRAASLERGVVETTSKLNANVFLNPDNLQNAIVDGTVTNVGLMADLGADQSTIDQASKALQRGLSDSAIRGHLEKGNFEGAKTVLLKTMSNLYDTDDQTKLMSEINNAEDRHFRAKYAEEDRIKAEANEKHEKQQNATMAKLFVAGEKASKDGDAITLARINNQIMEAGLKDDIPAQKMGGMINKNKADFKAVSAQTNYSVSQKFHASFDDNELEKIRRNIAKRVLNGDMTTEKAADWETRVAQKRKTLNSNPKIKAEISSFSHRLKGLTGDTNLFEKMFDKLGVSSALRRKHNAEADYSLAVSGGTPPKKAYHDVIKKYFRDDIISSVGIYPGYTKNISNPQELQEFLDYGKRNIPPGSDEFNAFSDYFKKASYFVDLRDKAGRELEAFGIEDVEQNTKLRGLRDAAVDVTVDIFGDDEELVKDRGVQIPLIQREEELYIFRR